MFTFDHLYKTLGSPSYFSIISVFLLPNITYFYHKLKKKYKNIFEDIHKSRNDILKHVDEKLAAQEKLNTVRFDDIKEMIELLKKQF